MSSEERAASASFTDPGFIGGESGSECSDGRFDPPGRFNDTEAFAGEGGMGDCDTRAAAGTETVGAGACVCV